jgi:hypothetical protein
VIYMYISTYQNLFNEWGIHLEQAPHTDRALVCNIEQPAVCKIDFLRVVLQCMEVVIKTGETNDIKRRPRYPMRYINFGSVLGQQSVQTVSKLFSFLKANRYCTPHSLSGESWSDEFPLRERSQRSLSNAVKHEVNYCLPGLCGRYPPLQIILMQGSKEI